MLFRKIKPQNLRMFRRAHLAIMWAMGWLGTETTMKLMSPLLVAHQDNEGNLTGNGEIINIDFFINTNLTRMCSEDGSNSVYLKFNFFYIFILYIKKK